MVINGQGSDVIGGLHAQKAVQCLLGEPLDGDAAVCPSEGAQQAVPPRLPQFCDTGDRALVIKEKEEVVLTALDVASSLKAFRSALGLIEAVPCASTSSFLYRVWSAALAEWQQRVGDNLGEDESDDDD